MARNRKHKIDRRKLKSRLPHTETTKDRHKLYRIGGAVLCLAILGIVGLATIPALVTPHKVPSRTPNALSPAEVERAVSTSTATERETRFFQRDKLTLVWDTIKPHIRRRLISTSTDSNIAPVDYAGPEACADCHKENYANWSAHSHRSMNAIASSETIMGDFSGLASIRYRGGIGKFFRDGDEFRMRYQRDDLVREYIITQTIGSRFYQYYVGRGVTGPEPSDHDFYKVDFVLPFGFWLDREAWVPIVHVSEENPEGERWESVEQLKPPRSDSDDMEVVGRSRGVVDHTEQLGLTYATSCNYCHTTFAIGEMMVRNPNLVGPTLTDDTLLEMSAYVAETSPSIWDGSQAAELFPSTDLDALIKQFASLDARQHAATLGISCEACHLGCKQHALNENSKPAFSPQNPHLLVYADTGIPEAGRTSANINAACARCHAGNRPKYAGGMSTWNSTEHTDAMRGSCYSELSCVHCHDPHKGIGKAWSKTPEQDDASCLACHDRYQQPDIRQLHTRHPAGSAGDRCQNCHMPKINEGMQDVVRTHTIFSPTQPAMLEANQPNACNLCHLEKSIDWTLNYLQIWYGRVFNEAIISANYTDRSQAVGLGWLQQTHEATRLVAVEAFAEQRAQWGLPTLVELLDDPFLLNRQFTQKSVESLSGEKLDERFGYWYYMTPDERKPLIKKILATLCPTDAAN